MKHHLSVKNSFAEYLLSFAVLLLSPLLAGTAAKAQVTTQVLALTGDPAPDGNGTFSDFSEVGAAVLNNAGQVAFSGFLTGTTGGVSDSRGVFLSEQSGLLTQIARAGIPAPDGNGTFSSFRDTSVAINVAGQVVFHSTLTGTTGGTDDWAGIFRGDPGAPGPLQTARAGDTAPDGNGTMLAFAHFPSLNNSGQVVFHSVFTGTTGGIRDDRGIYVGDGTNSLARIVRAGDATPNGDGSFDFFDSNFLTLNDAGQVAFRGTLFGASGGTDGGFSGIFLGDGTSGPVRIVRTGQTAPDGNGIFSGVGFHALNNAGQISFLGTITDTSGGNNDGQGIFLDNGASSPVPIVRAGDPAPDGNGSFTEFKFSTLNDTGQIAFVGDLTGTSGGDSDDSGLFRSDGTSSPVQIARAGDAALDGNGTFVNFGPPGLNDAGQAAFIGILTDTSGGSTYNNGLFFYDDLAGLKQVAREGDAFVDSTITDLTFVSSYSTRGEERSGFNELGQIAYRFELDDGREGIALASPFPTGPDTNGDGNVDGGDFLTLQRTNPNLIAQWQADFGPGSLDAATVPEPSALLLGLLASGMLLLRRSC